MANYDPTLITPTLTAAPAAMSGRGNGLGAGLQPHHGLVGIVLVSVLILFLLDRAGFRFAVTVGRR